MLFLLILNLYFLVGKCIFINNDITTEATNLDDYHDKNEQP